MPMPQEKENEYAQGPQLFASPPHGQQPFEDEPFEGPLFVKVLWGNLKKQIRLRHARHRLQRI